MKDENIEVLGYSTSSGVPETPYGEQTYQGAKTRSRNCMDSGIADCYVGLESGLVERYGDLYEEAWAHLITKDGKEYTGYSSGLKVPDYITTRMKELDMEHCDVMTLIGEELGNLPNDTWGTYSGGLILREISLGEAVRNALIQLLPYEQNLYGR